MDFDSLFIILIIVAFVARAIGEAFKGGKGSPQQQRRPRPEGRFPQIPGERPFPSGARTGSTTGETGSAADMVPPDLWAVLTGQQPPAPVPAPVPPRRVPYADVDEESSTPDEEAVVVDRSNSEDREIAALLRRRREALEVSRRVDRSPGKVVSLETDPLAVPVRHAAFHRKVDAARKAAPRAPTASRHRGRVLNIDEPDELRRAIILQEVLGPPKGLQ